MKTATVNRIGIFLILLLLLGAAFSSRAEYELEVSVDSTEADKNNSASVSVRLFACRGIDSLQFELWYDASVSELKSAEPGDLLKDSAYAINTEEPGKVRIAFANADGLREDSGVAAVLTFGVQKGKGTAVMVSEVYASRYEPGSANDQSKAFATIVNGGISGADGMIPETQVTPWIPETPTPTPEPTPESTPEPAASPEASVTETPSGNGSRPPKNRTAMLAYLFGGIGVLLLAAAAVVLLRGRDR